MQTTTNEGSEQPAASLEDMADAAFKDAQGADYRASYRGPILSYAVRNDGMPSLSELGSHNQATVLQEQSFFRKINPVLPATHPLSRKCNNVMAGISSAAGVDPSWANVVVYQSIFPDAHISFYIGEVRVSTGLLELLDYNEGLLAATLAHEISHPILKHTPVSPVTLNHNPDAAEKDMYEGGYLDSIRERVRNYEEEYQSDRSAVLILNRMGYKKGLMNEVLKRIASYYEQVYRERFRRKGPNKESEAVEIAHFPWIVFSHPYISRRTVSLDLLNRLLPGKGSNQKGARLKKPHSKDFDCSEVVSQIEDPHAGRSFSRGGILKEGGVAVVDCYWGEKGAYKVGISESLWGISKIKVLTPESIADEISDYIDGASVYSDLKPVPLSFFPEDIESFRKKPKSIEKWWIEAVALAQFPCGIQDLTSDISEYSCEDSLMLLKKAPCLGYSSDSDTAFLFVGQSMGLPASLFSVTSLLFKNAFGSKLGTEEGIREALHFLRDYRTAEGVFLPYNNVRLVASAARLFEKAAAEKKEELAGLFTDFEDELRTGKFNEEVEAVCRNYFAKVNNWLKKSGKKQIFNDEIDNAYLTEKMEGVLRNLEKFTKNQLRGFIAEIPRNYKSSNWTSTISRTAGDISEGKHVDDDDYQTAREANPVVAAQILSEEDFESEYFGEGRKLYRRSRYEVVDKEDKFAEDFKEIWSASGYGRSAIRLKGKQRCEFVLDNYRVSCGARDKMIVDSLGWHSLAYLEDVANVQKNIEKCRDIRLLSKLSVAFSHEFLRHSCSLRLWELKDELTVPIAQRVSREVRDSIESRVQEGYIPNDFESLKSILACFPNPSYKRDELLRPFVDASPDEESTMHLASFLSEPPPGVVQARREKVVAHSETLLDAIAKLDSLDKEEVLLYLLGHDLFFSGIDSRIAKANQGGVIAAEAKGESDTLRRKAIYEGRAFLEQQIVETHIERIAEDFDHRMEKEAKTSVLDELRNEEKFSEHSVDNAREINKEIAMMWGKSALDLSREGGDFLYVVAEPDSAVLLSKYAGIPLDLIMEQQRATTTRREQRDLVAFTLQGENGILSNGHGRQFLQAAAKTIVDKGRFEELSERERKAVKELLAFSLSECPRHKLPDLFLDCWYASAEGSSSLPELVAGLMEKIGPVFVKAGQYLSTQTASLPPGWTRAFRKLTDQNRVADKTMLYEYVHAEYGDNIPFAALGEKLGEGSMAAVYAGTIEEEAENKKGGKSLKKESKEVAVKTLHPFIVEEIGEDIVFLDRLVGFVNSNHNLYGVTLPKNLADVMKRQMKDEVSLEKEAENYRALSEIIADECRGVKFEVPAVMGGQSNASFLVMERARGLPLDHLAENHAVMRHAVGLEIYRQVISEGIYQADPNLGNFLANPDTRTVSWIDPGHLGRLSEEDRNLLKDFIINSVVNYSTEKIAPMLRKTLKTRSAKCEGNIKSWLEKRVSNGVSFASAERMLNEFMDFCSSHNYVIDEKWVSLLKTLNLTRPLLHDADPQVVFETLSPHVLEGLSLRQKLGLAAKFLTSRRSGKS